jgi:hypothetical protein
MKVPTDLAPGRRSLEFLEPFSDLPELLILAEGLYGRALVTSPGSRLAIFVIRPSDKSVTVIPQDWFNQGDYDFGYQWPTRVARDPESGRIFGEGIRIGAFRLNEAGNQVEKWFIQDPFYGPGSLGR